MAAILTLRYKDVLVYKYGCSDARFHSTGGMHWLLWRSIREAKQDGCRVFDLGRSAWEDAGLIQFKDRWGARRSVLTYLRFAASANSREAFVPVGATWKERAARKIFPYLPDPVLCALGNFLYRHMA